MPLNNPISNSDLIAFSDTSGNIDATNVRDALVESAGKIAEHQKHIEDELNFDFQQLPNGVADTVGADGTIIKRVKRHVLRAEDLSSVTAMTSYVSIAFVLEFSDSEFTDANNENIFIQGKNKVANGSYDVANIGSYFTTDTNRLGFIVAAGTTLAEIRNELDGVEVQYQLNVEQVIEQSNITQNTLQIAILKENTKRTRSQMAGGKINASAKSVSKVAVTFIADDGRVEDYTILKPIFLSENVPFSSAVVSSAVGSKGKMSVGQIIEIQDMGCEILSHSKVHDYLATMTEAQIEEQLRDSKRTLLSMGFNVESIVYPYGSFNNTVKRIANKYYRSGYLYGNRGEVNAQPYDTYAIKRIALGAYFDAPNTEFPITNTFEDYYKPMVDKALAENKWLVITLHPGALSGDFDETQQGYLVETIQYIKSLDIPIKTPCEVLDDMGNLIDLVSYSSTDTVVNYVKMGGDGVLTGSAPPPQWIYPELLNGWVSYPNATVRYTKDLFGNIMVRGRAVPTNSTDTKTFVLPAGYRPNSLMLFPAMSNNDFVAKPCFVLPDGSITVSSADVTAPYYSLDALNITTY